MSEKNWFNGAQGAFYIEETIPGLFTSISESGEKMVTSGSSYLCEMTTYNYMDWRVNGFPEIEGKKSYDSFVGGKL